MKYAIILLLLINISIIFASKAQIKKIDSLKKHPFGKNLLKTIQIQLSLTEEKKSAVQIIIEDLNNIKKSIEDDIAESEKKYQDKLNEYNTKLTILDNELVQLEDEVSVNKQTKSDAENALAQNESDLSNEKIHLESLESEKAFTLQKKQEKEEACAAQKKQTEINIIGLKEAQAIFQRMLDKAESSGQISFFETFKQGKEVMFAEMKTKPFKPLFMLLASQISELNTKDPMSYNRIKELVQDILNILQGEIDRLENLLVLNNNLCEAAIIDFQNQIDGLSNDIQNSNSLIESYISNIIAAKSTISLCEQKAIDLEYKIGQNRDDYKQIEANIVEAKRVYDEEQALSKDQLDILIQVIPIFEDPSNFDETVLDYTKNLNIE